MYYLKGKENGNRKNCLLCFDFSCWNFSWKLGVEMIYSNSSISCYKNCPMMFKIHYLDGYTPEFKSEAMETGINFHKSIANLWKNAPNDETTDLKILAMTRAYKKYLIMDFTFPDVEVEKKFNFNVGAYEICGFFDEYLPRNKTVIENKSTSFELTDPTFVNLERNQQVLMYFLASGGEELDYAVVKKPTIRQKNNESDNDFSKRLDIWYSEDTEKKVNVFELHRDEKRIEDYGNYLEKLISCIEETKLFYKNEQSCFRFGSFCEYYNVCNMELGK